MTTLCEASVQPDPVMLVPSVTMPLSIWLRSKTWMPLPPSLTA